MSLVSKKIRNFPRDNDVQCVNCGHPDCVWCHLPYYDAGIGQKTDDIFGFFGCGECHDYADGRAKTDRTGHSGEHGGRLDYEWRFRVMRASQRILLGAGVLSVK
jgi:hypothetical protein